MIFYMKMLYFKGFNKGSRYNNWAKNNNKKEYCSNNSNYVQVFANSLANIQQRVLNVMKINKLRLLNKSKAN